MSDAFREIEERAKSMPVLLAPRYFPDDERGTPDWPLPILTNINNGTRETLQPRKTSLKMLVEPK